MSPIGASAPAAPPCLLRLGLPGDAGIGDVRRAYATELKQINQESEGARFQQVREDYESALAWIHYRDSADVPHQPGQPVADAPASLPPDTPAAQAPSVAPWQRALDDFLIGSTVLASGPHLYDEDAWDQLLKARLEHEDLLNMDARAAFEQCMAERLTQDWHPGHDMLFRAAIKTFGWAGQRQQFDRMGFAGAFLNRAIHELAMYDNQDDDAHASQERLRERLRGDLPPDAALLSLDIQRLSWMLSCFPRWMAITVNPVRIKQWQEAHAALPPAAPSYAQRAGHADWQFTQDIPPAVDIGEQWRRADQVTKPGRADGRPGAAAQDAWDDDSPYVPMDGYRLMWRAIGWAIAVFALVIFLNVMRVLYV